MCVNVRSEPCHLSFINPQFDFTNTLRSWYLVEQWNDGFMDLSAALLFVLDRALCVGEVFLSFDHLRLARKAWRLKVEAREARGPHVEERGGGRWLATGGVRGPPEIRA